MLNIPQAVEQTDKKRLMAIRYLFRSYQRKLGDINYWSPSSKALLITSMAVVLNFCILIIESIALFFYVDSFTIDANNLRLAMYVSLFNCILLMSSGLFVVLLKHRDQGHRINLIVSVTSLLISMLLIAATKGFFDNVTWQLFFLFDVCLMIFLDRRYVFLCFSLLLASMIGMSFYYEYFPFTVRAIKLFPDFDMEQVNHFAKSFQWLQLMWVSGFGLCIMNMYFVLWRKRDVDLRAKSYRDELTQLLNRRAIQEGLAYEYQRANRLDYPLSLAIVDIDLFKNINDNFGHPFGDKVLQGVAEALQKLGRKNDLVGRYGGEEFLIVLPECDLRYATQLLEKFRQNIEALVFRNELGKKVSVTISIGLTQSEEVDKDLPQFIARADFALYQAKESGRNQVKSIHSEDDEIVKFLDTL